MLLPRPRRVTPNDAGFRLASANLTASFRGIGSGRVERALERAAARFAVRTGLPADGDPVPVELDVQAAASHYPGAAEDESYRLTIADQRIGIHAPTDLGALRAVATLEQLVTEGGELPCVHIEDAPRFAWRGLLLDCARHYLPAAAIERTLHGMASLKLNVLHLHLSDDQGFRFPSVAFPKLPSADHYSAPELRGIVELAADLGIRVVPELDMPGHVTCWLVAYPEWGSQPVAATRRFGVHPACLDPTREAVFDAVTTLLAEVADIFPDACLHIGGDEVHPDWWSGDERIGAFMRDHGMRDFRDLQAYFNRRVGERIDAMGRQVVAWDEVLHADLPDHWLVQAWRGVTARDRLLMHGNRVIMSAPYYLDLHYPADVYYRFDPAAPQQQLIELEDELLADVRLRHVADGMRWTRHWREGAIETDAAAAEDRLAGAEACLWGELVDADVLDQRLFSRLPALAERFWSEVDAASAGSLYPRVEHFQQQVLPLAGIDLAAQLETALARLGLDDRWQAIARLLEPVKWYGRLLGEQALAARLAGTEMPQARPYDADVPLTGLADALPPESADWRRVEKLIVEDGDPAAIAGLLEQWRRAARSERAPAVLAAFLPPLAALVDLIEQRLSGIQAAAAAIDQVTKPRGELLLALSPGLQRWLCGLP